MKFGKCSTLALLALTAVPAVAWEPSKPVEIVVAAARAALPTRWRG